MARDANATKGFGPFQYRNVIFQKDQRKAARKGYERKDYALYWGSRTVDYLVRSNLYTRDLELPETKVDVSDRVAITGQVKSAARWFGADLVGI
ncbi:hypothetical protein C6A36_02845, partial [Desulfobacteraceae bacterium SEEP-SAG10]